jgi:hypothetical protein
VVSLPLTQRRFDDAHLQLFEATSRWELAQFYGIAAPRYFYNQPGMIEKARNKSAINVRPAYLDSEYEGIGRGQGEDERNRRSIVGGSVPERAARAAAAAERSARGAILSALQDPQENVDPPAAGASNLSPAVPKPPGFRMPPGLRKQPQPSSAVPVAPPLRHPAQPGTPRADPVAAGVSESGTPSSATSSGTAPSKVSARENTKVKRNRRKTGRTDRSRHRVPTHL